MGTCVWGIRFKERRELTLATLGSLVDALGEL
jgi:hypothetical protein